MTIIFDGTSGIAGAGSVTGMTVANTAISGSITGSQLSTTAQYTGMKNRLINGDMRIWQRATSGTSIGTSSFGPDRWRNYGGNSLTLTSSTGYGSPQSLLIQASGTNHAVGQRIESFNIADLAGQTVTISYKIRADNPGTHNLLMYYANGVDNWSAETNIFSTAKSYVSNEVTTITHTVTLPALAINGVSVVLQWYNGGSSINLTAFVWDIQIEAGNVATSYDRRNYGAELLMCQRYYEKSYPLEYAPGSNIGGTGAVNNYGSSDGTSNQVTTRPFAVTKRTVPTMTYYTVGGTSGSWEWYRSGGSGTSTMNNYFAGTTSWAGYVGVGAAWASCYMYGQWSASAEL